MLQLFIFQVIQPESQLAVFTSFHLVLSRVTYALHFDVSCVLLPLLPPLTPVACIFLKHFFPCFFSCVKHFPFASPFFLQKPLDRQKSGKSGPKTFRSARRSLDPCDLGQGPEVAKSKRSRNKKRRKSCENTNSSNLSESSLVSSSSLHQTQLFAKRIENFPTT